MVHYPRQEIETSYLVVGPGGFLPMSELAVHVSRQKRLKLALAAVQHYIR
jgi:hypothetical protein